MAKPKYPYEPSFPAAAVFLVLFGITLAYHTYQMCQKKTWYMLVLVVATAMEVVGYASRILAINETESKIPRIISETMLVTAPALFAAQDYMIVGRMIAYVGGSLALIRDTWITKVFVIADILTIFTQVIGVVVLTGADTLAALNKAKSILLAGLSLQVIAFGIFVLITAHFDWKSQKVMSAVTMEPLRPLFIAIYITGSLITARSIFRTAEFGSVSFSRGAQAGYLVTHEWPFYVFDSVPIIISTFVINYIHPSDYLPARKGTHIDGSQGQSAGKAGHINLDTVKNSPPSSSASTV